MKTVILPDGYNGHTITCDAEPIAIDGNSVKLTVMQSDGLRYSGLIRWIRKSDLDALVHD